MGCMEANVGAPQELWEFFSEQLIMPCYEEKLGL